MDLKLLYHVIDKARGLGERKLENGTELIGHVPHIAPEAWLHLLFAPVQDLEINDIERTMNTTLPSDYSKFLRHHNGARLFSGDLWLAGYRYSFARTGDAVWQPYSIVSMNRDNPTINDSDPEIVIGGEESSGAIIRIKTGSQQVFKFKQRGKKPIFTWDNFESMLHSELQRLLQNYDSTGHRV